MGTFVEITCQDKQAMNEAFLEIKKIEAIANNFNPSSEISKLNLEGGINTSPDLFLMVKESLKYFTLSNGAFDITVAPMVSVWKQKIEEAQNPTIPVSLPSSKEIQLKLSLIGSEKISVDENTLTIAFTRAGMSIDLGAIAKGYAVDKAIARLKELGIRSCLVNAGGNMYCLGKKRNRKWRIGIRHPRNQEKILYYLDLENQAVATSGDYEQFFVLEGKRYSHIINPKTGYPVNNGIVSVTIITDNATRADALSTAVFVLGKEKGLGLAKRMSNTDVRIIEEKDI